MTIPDISTHRLAGLTVLWGLVFAAFHFYWAAGGDAGIGEGAQTLADSLYIAFIAVLGLAGAVVAHGLYRPWGARFGRRRLRTLARVGGVVLLLGVAVGVGRWIAAGAIGDDGAAGIVITAYFLLGGLLFSALGWGADGLRSAHETPSGVDPAVARPSSRPRSIQAASAGGGRRRA